MVVYLDIYFLKNIIFNFTLIYLTGILIKKKIKMHRIIFASLIGGFYAILVLYFSTLFNSNILKILISILMLIVSFGIKEITINLCCFFTMAYVIAGVVASIIKINEQLVMLFIAPIMIITYYVNRKNTKQKRYYKLHVEILSSEIELKAKVDTGNELRDSIFGNPVIVASEEKIKKMIDEELIKVLNGETLEIPVKYKNKIKIVSYKTISEEGIKTGVKLDKCTIYAEDGILESKATMILTKRNFIGYEVLIGTNLIEGGVFHENISFNQT